MTNNNDDEKEFKELSLKEKQNLVALVASPDADYDKKLEAYAYLCENGEEVVDDMIKAQLTADEESGQMLVEILANYKGRKDIFLLLVSYFYRGEDVALFARLLGSYGDEAAIDILKSFAKQFEDELNYNEFMEIRNAVEELGGDFDLNTDFSNDPFYRYLKGLDMSDLPEDESDDCDCEECDGDCLDDCDCDGHDGHCHDENCGCHGHKK